MGVDIVSCGTGKRDRRIANPGPYRAYLGYGISGGQVPVFPITRRKVPLIRALYGPGLLLRTLIFRNYVQKQVHFYTLFQESPDNPDLGQTGHFARTYKNAFVHFWEAKPRAGWDIRIK